MTWGLVSTILAPAPEILRFAAYHLEQGAHRLYLFLDDDNPEAYKALKAHPKIRVRTCDAAHWKKLIGKRPGKHQPRQSLNATHVYNRPAEVEWLAHIDVDEFLVSQTPVDQVLAALPADTLAARVRPMELLGGSTTAFKTFMPASPTRRAVLKTIYPQFGRHLRGGFLSHVAGKLFVRTGLPNIKLRIHKAFQDEVMLPDAAELTEVDLAHCHATSWDAWRAAYGYRLEKGSYRAELKPGTPRDLGGLTLHDLFRHLEAEQGDAGLRAFYDEVVGDSPDLRRRLASANLLRDVDLGLDRCVIRHFPDAAV